MWFYFITDELSTSALDQALVAEKNTIAGLSEGLNTLQTQTPALLSEIQSQTPALVDSLQQQAPAAISQVNKEVSTTMKALEKLYLLKSKLDIIIRSI